MARDYNINISVGGGDRRGAFTGGNVYKTKSTLNSRGTSDRGDIHSKSNLSRVFSIGLLFNVAQKTNEILGSYTENRLRQKRINASMTGAKYAIGLAINPAVGLAYAVGDLGYRGTMYAIKIQKENREATYYRGLSGNNSFSGSRYRGDYL
jgi:hypothetical protein